MRAHCDSHRDDACNTLDTDLFRRKAAKVDHHPTHRYHEDKHPLETTENLGPFGVESGDTFLFGGSAPAHIDAEHVCTDSEEQMEGYPSKEDHKKRHPHEVLQESADEGHLVQPVT